MFNREALRHVLLDEKMTVPRSDTEVETEVDASLAAWLGSGRPGDGALAADRALLFHRINLNGLGPLLALKSDLAAVPSDLAQFLRKALIAREMWEEQHRRVVSQALDALYAAGLHPLLTKGTALAYTLYPRPAARMRGDSDILIEENLKLQAFAALEEAGFSRPLYRRGVDFGRGDVVRASGRDGGWHDIDLHWRLDSSPVLARIFTHAELLARSQPVLALHAQARCPSAVDALLYSAVHRKKHIDRPTKIHLNGVAHPVIDSLTWLMDIHLLFGSLDRDEQERLVARAAERDISDILRAALADSDARLGTTVPDDIAGALASAKPGSVSRYIAAAPARAVLMNLVATQSLLTRVTGLSEIFFPPPEYMRARFSRGRADWLPVLYLRRILPGVAKHVFRKGKP
ncbi:nucleotidyltransferase family protein [Citreimonas salinaria]|uniref:nucleotidyltransferase family protein n=1 Tax=Citreimonas salinaria TaxID=321339 RepID=UPI0015A524F7|nr:nucleotidyltransferase family protein [Citreimonas salinaria]